MTTGKDMTPPTTTTRGRTTRNETATMGKDTTPPTTTTRGRTTRNETAPAPRLQASARRVVHRGEESGRREGARWPGDERDTTHPQPHELLLMGWIAGGTTTTTEGVRGHQTGTTRRRETKTAGGRRRRSDTPPTPSLTSNCSWGGSWVGRGRTTTTPRVNACSRGVFYVLPFWEFVSPEAERLAEFEANHCARATNVH
jgi:hypothetical protein